MPKYVDLIIAGTSTGGTGYITRILKMAVNHRNIRVIVETGEHQEKVVRAIREQVKLLNEVCIPHFNVIVTRRYRLRNG